MPVSAWENGKGWKCYQDGFCVSAGSMRSAFPFPFFTHSLSWVLCVALSILQSDLHALYCVFHCNPIECFVLCPPFSIVLISGRTSRKISLPQSIHPSRPPSLTLSLTQSLPPSTSSFLSLPLPPSPAPSQRWKTISRCCYATLPCSMSEPTTPAGPWSICAVDDSGTSNRRYGAVRMNPGYVL